MFPKPKTKIALVTRQTVSEKGSMGSEKDTFES